MTTLEIVKHYKTLLPCEQFLLTGSSALLHYGLVKEGQPGDIDIILINPTDAAREILNRLQEANPANTKPSSDTVAYIFKHENVKVDVFFETVKVQRPLTFDGIELNPINRIVAAKKKANRPKDWLQLRKMARAILTANEFETFCNNY